MKNTAFFVVAAALLVASCSGQEQPMQQAVAPSAPKPAPAPTSPRPQPAKGVSPERIAEIEASGQTGLWATVTEVCPRDIKLGLRTTLIWNVKATGAKRVIVYAVDPQGKEHNFGQGPAIWEKETGPWLRPGVSFRIRNYYTKDDLGSVVIGEKPC